MTSRGAGICRSTNVHIPIFFINTILIAAGAHERGDEHVQQADDEHYFTRDIHGTAGDWIPSGEFEHLHDRLCAIINL